jgi:hypothetical protein
MTCAALAEPYQEGQPAGRCPCNLEAETIGCRVPRTRREGHVEAVFEHAWILRMEDGALVAVLAQQAGNVARGIRLASGLPRDVRLQAGMRVRIDPQRLSFDDASIEVKLSAARLWAPELRPGMWDRHGNSLDAALTVRKLLCREAARSGSEFLAQALRLQRPPTTLAVRVSAILDRLGPAVSGGDRTGALNAVSQLIGLGPGLTPAGDDFIVGWLVGLMLLAKTPGDCEFLHAMCTGVEGLRFATTSVSSQHLDDACALLFSERLSDLCVAIAVGAPAPRLASRVSAQLAVGATSGADAAAGLMFALFDCGRSTGEFEGECRANTVRSHTA